MLIGHHNYFGEVFAHLVDLQVGDLILVYSGDKSFAYAVKLKMILPELGQPLEVRTQECPMGCSLTRRAIDIGHLLAGQ